MKLTLAGVPHHRVHEPWAPYNGALMALGLPPGKRVRALSGLSLYAHEPTTGDAK